MTLNRRDFAAAALAAGAAPTLSACATTPAPAASPLLIEAMTDKAVPGMAAIVIRDFHAEPELVAGRRALGAPATVQPGDRWHIGSNAKSTTATLVARLVEAGALAWDRRLADMLPELAPAMQAQYRDVTLPDLLSHRSGLPENTSDMDFFMSFHADAAPLPAQRLRYVARCLQDAPVGPARAASSYSNTGLLLAAACAEHATGRAFEDLIVAQVFQPLGMHSVRFDQFGGANEPQGHVDGRIANQQADVNPPMFAPAGAMRMSMGDWARFCIDHLRGEHGRGRILRQESYRFLHAPQGDTRAALGWGAAANPMGRRGPALTHSGSDGNWYALVCLFTETGNGVLVAANAADSMQGNEAALAAIRAFAATISEPAAA